MNITDNASGRINCKRVLESNSALSSESMISISPLQGLDIGKKNFLINQILDSNVRTTMDEIMLKIHIKINGKKSSPKNVRRRKTMSHVQTHKA